MLLNKIISKLFLYKSQDQEALEFGNDIASLTQIILSEEEIKEAESLIIEILSGNKRKALAIKQLQSLIGVRPKRPLYYVTEQFLPHLPHYTRDIMRYLGDYLDQLLKMAAKENHHGFFYHERSMGSNIHSLKGFLPTDIQDQLTRYNRDIYVPAKHDFEVERRNHRFTLKEVIFTVFITIKLAEEIKSISLSAQKYSKDKL